MRGLKRVGYVDQKRVMKRGRFVLDQGLVAACLEVVLKDPNISG